jgi:hypothetical protein
MNQFFGYVKPVAAGSGFKAMLRFAEDSKPNAVKSKGGKEVVYANEADAWKAVATHLIHYFNSPMFRSGEVVTAARSNADALFPTLCRQRGSSRVTKVERKAIA